MAWGKPARSESRRARSTVPQVAWLVGPTVKERRGGTSQKRIKKARSAVPQVAWLVGPTFKERRGGTSQKRIKKGAKHCTASGLAGGPDGKRNGVIEKNGGNQNYDLERQNEFFENPDSDPDSQSYRGTKEFLRAVPPDEHASGGARRYRPSGCVQFRLSDIRLPWCFYTRIYQLLDRELGVQMRKFEGPPPSPKHLQVLRRHYRDKPVSVGTDGHVSEMRHDQQ